MPYRTDVPDPGSASTPETTPRSDFPGRALTEIATSWPWATCPTSSSGSWACTCKVSRSAIDRNEEPPAAAPAAPDPPPPPADPDPAAPEVPDPEPAPAPDPAAGVPPDGAPLPVEVTWVPVALTVCPTRPSRLTTVPDWGARSTVLSRVRSASMTVASAWATCDRSWASCPLDSLCPAPVVPWAPAPAWPLVPEAAGAFADGVVPDGVPADGVPVAAVPPELCASSSCWRAAVRLARAARRLACA